MSILGKLTGKGSQGESDWEKIKRDPAYKSGQVSHETPEGNTFVANIRDIKTDGIFVEILLGDAVLIRERKIIDKNPEKPRSFMFGAKHTQTAQIADQVIAHTPNHGQLTLISSRHHDIVRF